MKPLSFIIVGSGWRSLFFARIAKRYSEQFCLNYMLCRTHPVREALEDAYIYLLMQEAVNNPGCKIVPQKMPWQEI